jgi:hypothetical protein
MQAPPLIAVDSYEEERYIAQKKVLGLGKALQRR